MTATYNLFPYTSLKGESLISISYLIDGKPDWDYERRAKGFYPNTPAGYKKAEAAGKRYLKKMKENGFEV